MIKRIFKFLFLKERDHLVKIVSVRPHWDDHVKAIGWPTMLIDNNLGRMTVTTLWEHKGRRDLIWRLRGWSQQRRYDEAIKRDYELVTEWNTTGIGPVRKDYLVPKRNV